MKQTTTYLGIERVTWEFDEADLLDAVLRTHKIEAYKPGRTLRHEAYEVDGKIALTVVADYTNDLNPPAGASPDDEGGVHDGR